VNFSQRIRELERKMANLIRVGTIESLDETNARVQVRFGNIVTAWIPWLTQRAGPDANWWAPEIGEQVLVMSPSGDFNLGVALPAIYQTAYPAPAATKDKQVVKWSDGSSLTYDRAAHKWSLVVPNAAAEVDVTTGGKINLVATGKVTISGSEIDLNGPVVASSSITASGDVIGQGTSLHNHVNTGVTAGGSNSGPPA